MRASTAFAVSLLVLAPACGDDDGLAGDASPPDAGIDAPPPSPTLDDICNSSDGVFVDLYGKLFQCFPELGFVFGGVPATTDLARICDGALQPYLDDGTVMLGSAESFADCRAYLDGVDCNSVNDQVSSPCDDLLIGTIPLNEDCDSNDQCVGEAYCDKSGPATCGICRSTKGMGTTCQEDAECASRFCHTESHQCDIRARRNDACASKADCGGTRVCSPTSNTCVDEPTWAVDSPCRDFLDCDLITSGLYCDTTAGHCRQFLALDATCGGDTALCDFIHYQHCAESPPTSGTFKCVAPTSVANGETCNFFEGTQCQSGSVCTDTDGNDQTPSICLTPGDIGDTCNDSDMPCKVLLTCVGGRCQIGSHTGECPAP